MSDASDSSLRPRSAAEEISEDVLNSERSNSESDEESSDSECLSSPLTLPVTQPARGVQVVDYSEVVQGDLPPGSWGRALQRVIKAIVTIKVTVLRTFDTHHAGTFEGTGFVVDRTRGIILSNRHIVTQAPVTATAIFPNYEEIALKQGYVDPVHDFGFFHYDPAKVKYADVEEIELYPEGAKVGVEIKVCGNDASEKLSILSATLGRIDRDAPLYGDGYNDFNINYLQAASMTSGGSSGSPVLDIEGRAIALNAGGDDDSASSFFLPLEPVVRALKSIQRDEPLPREGLCRERNPTGTGMLRVSKVLPEGPGYNSGLEIGDVLIECREKVFGNRFIQDFHSMWEMVDGSIGKEITLTVYSGEELKEIVVTVQDLALITPNTFVDICGGIFHPMSYQLAMAHNLPCKGIYAPKTGQFQWENTSDEMIITQIAGKPMDSLDDFTRVILAQPDRTRVSFRYMILGGRAEQPGVVEIDHRFYPSAQFTKEGTWTRKVLTPNYDSMPRLIGRAPTMGIEESPAEILRRVLVVVDCRVPYSTEGASGPSRHKGVGILVATGSQSLILTSRTTVVCSLCDISVTIGKRRIPSRLVYLGWLAVLTVDSGMLPASFPVPKISAKESKVGDAVELLGLNTEHQVVQKRTEISSISALEIPEDETPAWRINNMEYLDLFDTPDTLGGILIDPSDSSLVAFWMEVKYSEEAYGNVGINYRHYIQPIVEALRTSGTVQVWSPGYVFGQLHLAKAIDLGMPEHHATQVTAISRDTGTAAHAIWVTEKQLTSASGLEIGDVLLEIEDKPVGRMADISCLSRCETTKALVLRDRQKTEFLVRSKLIQYQKPPSLLCFAGALLQCTPRFALEQTTSEFLRAVKKHRIEDLESLVYVCGILLGSPAHEIEDISPTQWLLEVNKQKVTSMDTLLDIVESLKGRDVQDGYVQVKLIGKDGAVSKVGVRLNSQFWSSWTLEYKDKQWQRTELE